jgi:hypothetical protein
MDQVEVEARGVQKIFNSLLSAGLAAAMVILTVGGTHFGRAQSAPGKKAYKNAAEADLYGKAMKSLNAKDWKQTITDLDAWKQQVPDSAFKDDREVYYVQAYGGSGQFAKVLETAGSLIDRDLAKVLDDPTYGPAQQLQVLVTAVQATPQIANPTPQQLAMGEKAAHLLADYNTKPANLADADWAKAREQLQTMAKGVSLYIASKPGADAMQKKDYPAAEAAYAKAQEQFPENGQIAYQLGAAQLAQQSASPAKVNLGLYSIARAVSLDPAKGGLDPKAKGEVDAYLKKVYIRVHGSDEGLDQLKQQAAASPAPAAGFKIRTATEIADEKQAEFEKTNPQLAMWMKIKGALADTNGETYFDGSLKGAAVPKLKGILVDAKPACRPTELMVAVPLPDAKTPYTAEITLKLVDDEGKAQPLAGKPELNSEFQWEGVPAGFAKEPFMLTMDSEKGKLEGIKTTPCTAAPARRAAPAKKK